MDTSEITFTFCNNPNQRIIKLATQYILYRNIFIKAQLREHGHD